MLDDKIVKYLMQTFGLNDVSDYKVSRINEGLSGSDVYILDILRPRRKRDRGIYILKVIDTLGKWYDKENNEVIRSKRIYDEAINFQKNLVKVQKDVIIDNKLVIILSFALGSETSSISMAQLRLDNKLKLLERISYDLLKKLNLETLEFTDEGEMIEKLCTYRLEQNGNFVKRSKQYIYEIDKPAININGIILPNPYYYISMGKLKDIMSQKHIQYIKGITHGDLHQKNVLTLDNGNEYEIIDYDSCTPNYLLFDQAYLELNVFSQFYSESNLEKWVEGMGYAFKLHDDENESVEHAGIINIESRIRNGMIRWYCEELPNLLDSFYVQLQLARIAAGINYFSKNAINSTVDHVKYLIYIGLGLKSLFLLYNYDWDKNNVSRLINKEKDSNRASTLWNECGKLRNEYVKVLITDDEYTTQSYSQISNIAELDWRLIVDVGNKKAPDDLVTAIVPIIKEFNSVKFIDNEMVSFTSVYGNTNILQLKSGKNVSSFEHWKIFKRRFLPLIKSICSSEPLKSVLFVLDIHEKQAIRERMIEMLWEENYIRKGSRFVCLGRLHELPLQETELEEGNIKYFQHDDMDLSDIVRMIDDYGLHRERSVRNIYLPSLESLDGRLDEAVWNDYNSVVELVYPGMENNSKDYTNGEEFYKGNEISWLDLAQKKDIEWRDYTEWKEGIIKKLQNERITECRLIHGAGAGGTTLSKRLMWDIKDINPTLRVRKFNEDTANVIIDIYRKTGKCVFVVLEMGSTVISEDEFDFLKRKVNAQSCHALFLKIERTISKDEDERADIYLSEELKERDAENFFITYSSKTENEERRKNLSSITYDFVLDEWRGQRCPFFYGFYTFQEEYQGLGRFLMASVERCNKEIKSILADLAIITMYSQNICMPYEEMIYRLGFAEANLVEIFRQFNEGIEKILIQKEKGFRICHPLIARKLLELIYSEYKCYSEQLYFATMNFINNMNDIYGEIDREYLDEIFKELFIDRSYIDGEHQKFALLINDMGKHSNKTKVFERLIELYSDNPHYYNHLGRLEIFEEKNMQFDKAIVNLKKALSIAQREKLNQVPHYTTLGCIYSKKVLNDMAGRDMSIQKMLDIIRVDFGNASECFLAARKLKENSTYAYFPNILMICNVVKRMEVVIGGSLQTLLKDEVFKKWYNRYSGIAIQLFSQMKRSCDQELTVELREKAEQNIKSLTFEIDVLKSKLIEQRKAGLGIRECSNLGRTISMLLYMRNEFKWEGMNKENLFFAEKEMENILEGGEYNQNDVIAWFNIYRQMENFDTARAKRYILDYMEENYYKNYLLWILSFCEYENGILPYVQVEKHLNACRHSNQLIENNIRTTRNVDVYTMREKGFPIKKFSAIKNDDGESAKLRTFTGTIIGIDGTVKGKIKLDGLDDIVVTFVPSFVTGDQKREFTRDDISSRVEFNLIFTYSGYKAWDPKKI